jgi:hypothetical protein
MTVTSTDIKTLPMVISGVGPYYFVFRAMEEDEIKVVVGYDTILTYATDYTVSIDADGNGGTVTLSSDAETLYDTDSLVVYRETDLTQENDFFDYDSDPALTKENSFDKLTNIAQETDETAERAIYQSIGGTIDTELPEPEAGKFIIFNSGGTALENSTNTNTEIASAIEAINSLDGGDAQITDEVLYTNPEIGGEQRPLTSRLSDIDTLYDFGPSSMGSGATDVSAELGNADDADGAIFIPYGTFKISSNITLSSTVHFIGGKLSVDSGFTVTFDGAVNAEKEQIIEGDGSVVFSIKTKCVYPEWFGAVGVDGTDDDSTAIQKAHDACETNRVPVKISGVYGIGTKLSWIEGVPMLTDGDSFFLSHGGEAECIDLGGSDSDGNFRGITYLPSIQGFTSYGVKLLGVNDANIHIHLINLCGTAIVLETLVGVNDDCLDNNITVQQIANCDKGIAFSADAAANIMQGNEIRCNFMLAVRVCVLFKDEGGLDINWDSNSVICQAVDPLGTTDNAVVVQNANSKRVSRFSFRCESWCGGINDTSKRIEGKFDDSQFYFDNAGTIYPDTYDCTGTNNIYEVCTRNGNSSDYTDCSETQGYLNFNNGGAVPHKSLVANRENLTATVASSWAVGDTKSFFVYHMLTDKHSNVCRVLPASGYPNRLKLSKGALCIGIHDRSSEGAGHEDELEITFMNVSNAAIPAGNHSFVLEIGI